MARNPSLLRQMAHRIVRQRLCIVSAAMNPTIQNHMCKRKRRPLSYCSVRSLTVRLQLSPPCHRRPLLPAGRNSPYQKAIYWNLRNS